MLKIGVVVVAIRLPVATVDEVFSRTQELTRNDFIA